MRQRIRQKEVYDLCVCAISGAGCRPYIHSLETGLFIKLSGILFNALIELRISTNPVTLTESS